MRLKKPCGRNAPVYRRPCHAAPWPSLYDPRTHENNAVPYQRLCDIPGCHGVGVRPARSVLPLMRLPLDFEKVFRLKIDDHSETSISRPKPAITEGKG